MFFNGKTCFKDLRLYRKTKWFFLGEMSVVIWQDSPYLSNDPRIYIYIYMCVCVCVCVCVCFGSISSLIHISLNIIDIFCLHVFLLILSNCRFDLMIFCGNWLINLPWLVISQVLSSKKYRRSSSYKVVMCIQKLDHFCNTSSSDDDPKLGRKYLGNN